MSLDKIKEIILNNNNEDEDIVENVEVSGDVITITIKEEFNFERGEDVLNCIHGIEENEYNEIVIGDVAFEVIDDYINIELKVSYKSEIIEDVKDNVSNYLYEEMSLYNFISIFSNICNDITDFSYDTLLEQSCVTFYVKDSEGNYIDNIRVDIDFEVVEVAEDIEDTEIKIVYIEVIDYM